MFLLILRHFICLFVAPLLVRQGSKSASDVVYFFGIGQHVVADQTAKAFKVLCSDCVIDVALEVAFAGTIGRFLETSVGKVVYLRDAIGAKGFPENNVAFENFAKLTRARICLDVVSKIWASNAAWVVGKMCVGVSG